MFRNRSGERVKVLWYDGQGMCLLYKRIDRSTFVWPRAGSGAVSVTAAQLASLLEGMDWRLTRALPQMPRPSRVI